MLAALMVGTMAATVEALLDAPPDDPLAEQEIVTTAEAQLRLIVLAIPHWHSDTGTLPAAPCSRRGQCPRRSTSQRLPDATVRHAELSSRAVTLYAALNRRDWDAFFAQTDPEVEWTPLDENTSYRGRGALIAYIERRLAPVGRVPPGARERRALRDRGPDAHHGPLRGTGARQRKADQRTPVLGDRAARRQVLARRGVPRQGLSTRSAPMAPVDAPTRRRGGVRASGRRYVWLSS